MSSTALSIQLGTVGVAVGSFFLTGLVRRYSLARGIVDQPGPRRSHCVTTARGGGLAIVLLIVICALLLAALEPTSFKAMATLATSVGVIAGLGWWDDHRPLSARLRFVIQLLVCLLALAGLDGLGDALVGRSAVGPVWLVLALLAMLWLTNLFNFMDGTDGLAALEAFWALLAFALMFSLQQAPLPALLAALAAAAVLGFLPWNLPLPRAKIFMGDVGSATLGFLLGAFCVIGTHHGIPIQISFIVLSVFIVDATATLLLRIARNEQWYNAHRQHAYQRLVRAGWSHGRLLLLLALVNAAVVGPVWYLAWRYPDRSWLAAALLASLLFVGWSTIQYRYRDENLAESNDDTK